VSQPLPTPTRSADVLAQWSELRRRLCARDARD
jgi:hypothetical protein